MLDLTGLDLGQSSWPRPEPLPWGLVLIAVLGPVLAIALWSLLLRSIRRRKRHIDLVRFLAISHLLGLICVVSLLLAYALLSGVLVDALLGEKTVTPRSVILILVGYLGLSLLLGMGLLLVLRASKTEHIEPGEWV
jgi:hypothetical protein